MAGIARFDNVTALSSKSSASLVQSLIYWGKQLGEKLPDLPKEDVIPEVGELDELETFIGSKKTKFGCGQQ